MNINNTNEQLLMYFGHPVKGFDDPYPRYTLAEPAELSSEANTLTVNSLQKLSASGSATMETFYSSMVNAAMRTPTGVGFFDKLCGGGLYNGFTTIGGMPNIGKTSLLVQVAVESSLNGQPVVYITNDMGQREILLKVLNYISCNMGCKQNLNINELTELLTRGEPLPEELIKAHELVSRNLHIRELGYDADLEFDAVASNSQLKETDTIGRIVELYCMYFAKKPIFIIDSLQSLSIDLNKSGKEAVDLTLELLKCIQRKYQVPMVLVSNLNRVAYNTSMGLTSFKESGMIEYASGTIIALEADLNSYVDYNDFRRDSVRKIIIRSLKDRTGGYQEIPLNYNVEMGLFFVDLCAEIVETPESTQSMSGMKVKSNMNTSTTTSKSKANKAQESAAIIEDILRKQQLDN